MMREWERTLHRNPPEKTSEQCERCATKKFSHAVQWDWLVESLEPFDKIRVHNWKVVCRKAADGDFMMLYVIGMSN
jgi:hypothetical protein